MQPYQTADGVQKQHAQVQLQHQQQKEIQAERSREMNISEI
jgi:hypothetical protein